VLGLVTCWLCHWCPPCEAIARQAASITVPAHDVERPRSPQPQPQPSPPPPPVKRPQLPDAVVVSVMDVARPTLAACVRRARTRDPSMGAIKISLHLEIDADGAVTAATLALDDELLQRCILSVARGLHFPAPGRPAAAELAFIAG